MCVSICLCVHANGCVCVREKERERAIFCVDSKGSECASGCWRVCVRGPNASVSIFEKLRVSRMSRGALVNISKSLHIAPRRCY